MNKIQYIHTGITSSCIENADRFFSGILGMTKSEPKETPAPVCNTLFGIQEAITRVNYTGEQCQFEVFIRRTDKTDIPVIAHTCIAVPDLKIFLDTCRTGNIEIKEFNTGAKNITFIKDYDGNLYELQQSELS